MKIRRSIQQRAHEQRSGTRDDLEAELAFHFDASIRELRRQGLSIEDARREARKRFGDLDDHRRRIRRIDRRGALGDRIKAACSIPSQTLKQVLRGLRNAPGFAACVVVTLALGIGVNAAMFEIVDKILLQAPPHIQHPEDVRLIYVNRGLPGRRATTASIAYPDLVDFESADSLEQVAGMAQDRLSVESDHSPVNVTLTTGPYFSLLGVQPAMGRFFSPADDSPGAQPTAVLSYKFWKTRFSSDPDVLGRQIDVGGDRCTIIGVAPRGFNGTTLSSVSLWLPFWVRAEREAPQWRQTRGFYWIQAIGRLAPGASVDAAEEELTALHRQGRADSRSYDKEALVIAASVIAGRGPSRSGSVDVAQWLAGVSAIVLIIACANVANLLLARGLRRRQEVAVRLAMGISRGRLFSHLVAESLMLALLGGIVSIAVSVWGGGLIRTLLLPNVDWSDSWLNPRTLVFIAVACLIAGTFTGLVPALQVVGGNVADDLRSRSRDQGTGRRTRLRFGLQVAQGALCAILLVGAGLFVRSFHAIQSLDLGLNPQGVAAIGMEFPAGRPQPDIQASFERAVRRLEETPGIQSAALTSAPPLLYSFAIKLRLPGRDSHPSADSGGPYIYQVTPDYFSTLGMTIARGRAFQDRDDSPSAPRVVIVNETMARHFWPGKEALGECLLIGEGTPPCSSVVGILKDPRREQLLEGEQMLYYVPLHQNVSPPSLLAIVAKSAASDAIPTESMRNAVVEAVPELSSLRIVSLEEILDPQKQSWRLGAALFSLFGVLALAVAAVGTYSVLAFDIAHRTHELGVRAALGAGVPRLMLMVFSHALRLAALSVGLGIAVVLAAGSAIAGLLYRVSPHDPLSIAVAAAILAASAALAGILPARRASRADPAVALRAE